MCFKRKENVSTFLIFLILLQTLTFCFKLIAIVKKFEVHTRLLIIILAYSHDKYILNATSLRTNVLFRR